MRKILIAFAVASMIPIFYVIAKHFWRGGNNEHTESM